MPDTLVPPEQVAVEEPPALGICPSCNTNVYEPSTDFMGKYLDYYRVNYIRYSTTPQGQYAPINIVINDEPQVAHRMCIINCTICDNEAIYRGHERVQGDTYCKQCFDIWYEDNDGDEYARSCEGCGSYDHQDNMYYSNWLNDWLCETCDESRDYECNDCGRMGTHSYLNDHECDYGEESDSDSPYIHNYSYKPRPTFFGDTKYHFGIELEVEASRNGNYSLGAEMCYRRLSDRGYLKYDGSLSNGFEIVSHPHSLQEIQENFPWEMVELLKADGFRSWNTTSCGLHVHVSRTAFTAATYNQRETHQIKFMKLIYDNQRQVQRLAGRKSNYATFDDKGKVVKKVKMGNQSSGRYSAVNIDNDTTIEVRVFRGSLRKERVLSAVEFVHAAVEYTRNLKIVTSDKPLSWAKFVGYVSQQYKTYPNLFLIMNELFDKEDINQPEEDN